jgi:lipoprotein-anchoring transpeptidase ErfK/SrfK
MSRASARAVLVAAPLIVSLIALLPVALAHDARADTAASVGPPWTDLDEMPLPTWATALVAKKGDMIVYAGPSRASPRRGLTQEGARLPLHGAKRGAGCAGRWLLVGPLSWVCSESAELTSDEPGAPGFPSGDDGLPFRYFFTGHDGANAYKRLEMVGEAAPDRELESSWAVAVLEQRRVRGETWGHAKSGGWISMRDLHPANPSPFHGASIEGALDLAWVVSDKATTYTAPWPAKPLGVRVRFERVGWHDEKKTPMGLMARVSPDGASPAEWMLARDLAHPTLAPPPSEVTGAATGERWIDVHLASQTLVAYEGARPVFATMVSSGRGPPKSESATPPGVHRIWVKIAASTMDNAERDDVGKHYSMEDVPYVMFFDKAVALHGAYWHHQFGRVKSHGCVNLAPLDARYLFGFTAPHLPMGWLAAYPTPLEKGTAVRVR